MKNYKSSFTEIEEESNDKFTGGFSKLQTKSTTILEILPEKTEKEITPQRNKFK